MRTYGISCVELSPDLEDLGLDFVERIHILGTKAMVAYSVGLLCQDSSDIRQGAMACVREDRNCEGELSGDPG